MSDVKEVLKERGTRYGEFSSHAAISQALKTVIQSSPNFEDGNLEPYQIESLEMIAHKIARILNGDPDYDDNWIDIAGYAQLVVNELKAKERQ